jgi:polyisoprenoid-binding protein YceI
MRTHDGVLNGGFWLPAAFAEGWRRGVPAPGRVAVAALLLFAGAGLTDAEPETFVVDAESSRVRVHLGRAGLLRFMGHEHEIAAPIAEGRVEVEPADPSRSLVDLRWQAALLAIVPGTEPEEDVPTVEERMRGPEVLDVTRHVGIRFWSFEVLVEDADPAAGRWRLRLRGGLELKGERRTVEIPVEVRRRGADLVATGEAKLRLRDLGVEPPSVAGVVKVSNDFRVTFEVRARRTDPRSSPAETVGYSAAPKANASAPN